MNYGLYDYQREAVDKLRSGSILCGGVGSGKSRTSLAYFVDKECGGIVETDGAVKLTNPKDLYVITTAKKRDSGDWEKEMVYFLLHGTESLLTKVTVDSWNNIGKYESVKNAFFIFDEQRVVGYGKWSRTFIKIAKANHWILLTATPGDVWTDYIPVFVANGFYKGKSDFLYKHAVFDRYSKYPKIRCYMHEDILEKHREELLIDMDDIRRATRFEHEVYVDYDTALYSKVFNDRWNVYKDRPIKDAGEMCYVLRRVVNENNERLKQLLWCYRKYNKVLVFYNFDYELELMKNFFESNKITYTEYNGHKHEGISTEDKWVYLVQYTAGAEGWNCIETNVTVFFSQTYSYKALMQSMGRIDRLNTPFKELHYYHILSKSTIDMAIKKALRRKKNFNNRDFINM